MKAKTKFKEIGIKVKSKAGSMTKQIQYTIDRISVIGTKEIVFYDNGDGLRYNIQPTGHNVDDAIYYFNQHSPDENDLWFYYDDTNIDKEDYLEEYIKDLKIDLKKDVKKTLKNK